MSATYATVHFALCPQCEWVGEHHSQSRPAQEDAWDHNDAQHQEGDGEVVTSGSTSTSPPTEAK